MADSCDDVFVGIWTRYRVGMAPFWDARRAAILPVGCAARSLFNWNCSLMRRHQEAADELSRLRDAMNSLSAELLAQSALTGALLVLVAREVGWRAALGEIAGHAADMVHESPLDGDAQWMTETRDRALCLIEDKIADLQRNFAGSECHPWVGTA
jgi:hypothetical protein